LLAIDRTHVADEDKLLLEPVIFLLSIIPSGALSNHPFAWRPLGFIPKFLHSKSLFFNAQTYHRVLGRIISSRVCAQNNGGIKCQLLDQLDAGGTETEFCFKVLLTFVIGDVTGHEVLMHPVPHSKHQNAIP
jgi:hypothetical protein